jgi:signal transduction histidine kinase
MAEVATGVLHNVGNVLNSVNVSINLLSDQVRQSKIANLARAAALMRDKGAGLGEFLTRDAQGQQLPGYLEQLGDYLLKEQTALLQELQSLRGDVDHINQIVAMQQSYAKVAGVSEIVHVTELVEDAFKINAGALIRHDVQLVRQYDPNLTLQINVEKHKVLEILINLIRNAKYACDDSSRPDKRITLCITNGEGRVEISVADNGVGIPPENLARIFNHGFTTRKGGHGFGLHSGALTAKELGGALRVQSDGPGQGATFTLELPLLPAGAAERAPAAPENNSGASGTAAPLPAYRDAIPA